MLLVIAKDREERQRALETALKKEQAPVTFFHPDNFESFSLEVETFPFLSNSKAIVVQRIDELDTKALEQLHAYVEKPNEWISLYLTASSLPQQSKLVKRIENVIQIKEEKPWEKEKRLAGWVIEEAASAGVAMPLSVAQVFVKAVDHQYLKIELEKLICFVGEKHEISLDAIRAICTPIHHETLWQLGEAIFARQPAAALQIGKALLEDGMALFPLLAHLRTQFHTMLKILAALQQGGKPAVSQGFPYLKGGLLDKKVAIAQRYGSQRLKQGFVSLFETELKAKNSAIDPALLLEILLVKITHDSLSTAECAGSY